MLENIEFLDIKWYFTPVYKTGGIVCVFFKLLGKNVLRRATYIISLSNEFEVEQIETEKQKYTLLDFYNYAKYVHYIHKFISGQKFSLTKKMKIKQKRTKIQENG